MQAKYLAFACALIPTLTVHSTLTIALVSENLHACNPYWWKCHSISATGRQYPEFFVFKALMIPVAVLMLAYWHLLVHWLVRHVQTQKAHRWVRGLGTIAAVALIVYTVTLGAKGEPYALARRIGVVCFFAFSAFAHLLVLAAIRRNADVMTTTGIWYRSLLWLSWSLLLIGFVSPISGFVWSGYQYWDNAIEWWFALLMMGQFALMGKIFHCYDLRLTIHSQPT